MIQSTTYEMLIGGLGTSAVMCRCLQYLTLKVTPAMWHLVSHLESGIRTHMPTTLGIEASAPPPICDIACCLVQIEFSLELPKG